MNKFKKVRKVMLYPPSKSAHSSYGSLFSNPPKGYEIITVDQERKFMFYLKRLKFIKNLYFIFKKFIKKDIYNKLMFSPSNSGADIIFSRGVLYPGKKPWILDIIDAPQSLAGYDHKIFINNLKEIDLALSKKNCKAISCANETVLKVMQKYFSKKVIDKITLIKTGLEISQINKVSKINNSVNFLFVGSVLNPDDFLLKGGIEALEVFKKFNKKHSNLKFVIRCKVSKKIKKKYSGKNIKFIEQTLSPKTLRSLYNDAHILLMPGHTYFLMGTLEAMSFGIPIVALDTYAAKDYIQNEKSGFLIKPSNKIPYNSTDYPTNVRSKKFVKAIKNIDPRVIYDLSNKVEKLINNPRLRNKMANKSREIIIRDFSIKQRNEKLKKLLDGIF